MKDKEKKLLKAMRESHEQLGTYLCKAVLTFRLSQPVCARPGRPLH